MTTGLWKEKGVPHKGWEPEGVKDLGHGKTQVCDMCQVRKIRYVHYVSHEDYEDGPLQVGVECAGNMTGDSEGARDRQKRAEKRGRRRDRFPNASGWRKSKAGDWFIKEDGYVVLVKERRGGHTVTIKRDGPTGSWINNSTVFDTWKEARTAGFDMVQERFGR